MFLEGACSGDGDLRLEVESLLARHTQAEGFIESPALDVAAKMLDSPDSHSVIGCDIGPYHIVSLLGAGGMGEVYLAQDVRLGRKLALKLLPEAFTGDRERLSRFEREARAASALNHPNIVTIHDVGVTNGLRYIATEFVEGNTLRRILCDAPLKFELVLDIALQVASGLTAAHDARIIHRDIKPENIMVRPDGLVKLLDFGLAKLTEPLPTAGPDTQAATRVDAETQAGMVMGTTRYMSPEQARGLAVDRRTDLFSFGAVLYEMIAGAAPFKGDTTADIIASILAEKPAPLPLRSGGVPPELDRIVNKCLEKDPERRYQSAAGLLADLRSLKQDSGSRRRAGRSLGGRPSMSRARWLVLAGVAILVVAGLARYLTMAPSKQHNLDSVAVLPFTNDSADPNLEYLSDGITDGITYSLSRLTSLKVKPHNSVFQYKGRQTDPQAVGAKLGVQAVAMGRVVPHGDGVTISAELVDVESNTVLWGMQYDRTLSDVQSAQEDISRQIAERLRLKLSGEEKSLVGKRYSKDSEAYLLYLKGRYYWNKRTQDGVEKAVDYFQQATDKDPNFALAFSGLADCYNLYGSFDIGLLSPNDAMPKARAAAAKALELDDTLAEAHNSLAYEKLLYEWDWSGAETEFKRALELKPNYADAHHWYSHYLVAVGRGDESLAESKRALELDPLSLVLGSHLGWHYIYAHQYGPAIEQLQKTLAIAPKYGLAHWYLALAYEQEKMYPEAGKAFQTASGLQKATPVLDADIGHYYAVSSRRSEALKTIAELKERSKTRYVSSYGIALIYAGLGEEDQALDWLDKACDEHADSLIYLAVEPRLSGLSSHPRFKDLLRRIHYPGS